MGPKYAAWRFGPEDTDQVIRGMAADWCRVVTLRQPASRDRVEGERNFGGARTRNRPGVLDRAASSTDRHGPSRTTAGRSGLSRIDVGRDRAGNR